MRTFGDPLDHRPDLGRGWGIHSLLSGFGSREVGALSGFPPVGMFSDPLITDYFEGREAFWDPFVTPSRKPSPLGGRARTPEL